MSSKTQPKGFFLGSLKQDDSKVKDGVLVPFNGCMLRIRRYGSHGFNKQMSTLYKANEMKIKSGSEEGEDLAKKNIIDCFANHILVGWEDVIDANGKDVPYSVKAAKEFLEIDEVFDFVDEQSKKHANYRIESTQELGEELKK